MVEFEELAEDGEVKASTTTTIPTATRIPNAENLLKEGWDDVLGSGAVLRRTLKEATGAVPDFKQEVHVSFSVWVHGRPEARHQEEVSFIVGDMEVVPCLEVVCRSMHIGEVVGIVTEHRFAYGDKGKVWDDLKVPPLAVVEFKVELLSIGNHHADPASLSLEDRINKARDKKEKANGYFKEGDYERAIQLYQGALGQIVPPEPFYEEGEETETANAHRKVCADVGNNLGIAYVKTEQLLKAKEALSTVMVVDERNVKARCKAAEVEILLGSFAEAAELLKAASAQADDPQAVKMVNAMSRKVKEATREYKQKEKSLIKRMMKPEKSAESEPKKKADHLTAMPAWRRTLYTAISKIAIDLVIVAIGMGCLWLLAPMLGTMWSSDAPPSLEL